MVEMPEVWTLVLDALIAAPIAWQSPGELASALGQDVEETTDLLSALDVAGWIAVWDGDPEPLITLSPLAAERLEVLLVEVGPDELPRWARIGDPLPPVPRARNVCRSERSASLDSAVDPSPSPDLVAERAELIEARAATYRAGIISLTKVDELPLPGLLLGVRLIWPGPVPAPFDACPACGSRPLRPHEYCLYCNQWGLDDVLAALNAPRTPTRPRPSPPAPAPDRLAEPTPPQSARARRKAKRKARRIAQAKDQRRRS